MGNLTVVHCGMVYNINVIRNNIYFSSSSTPEFGLDDITITCSKGKKLRKLKEELPSLIIFVLQNPCPIQHHISYGLNLPNTNNPILEKCTLHAFIFCGSRSSFVVVTFLWSYSLLSPFFFTIVKTIPQYLQSTACSLNVQCVDSGNATSLYQNSEDVFSPLLSFWSIQFVQHLFVK